MKGAVRLSPSAEADLANIWAYIALERAAPKTADAFIVRLRRKCDLLASSPAMGRERSDLGRALRSLPFER